MLTAVPLNFDTTKLLSATSIILCNQKNLGNAIQFFCSFSAHFSERYNERVIMEKINLKFIKNKKISLKFELIFSMPKLYYFIIRPPYIQNVFLQLTNQTKKHVYFPVLFPNWV